MEKSRIWWDHDTGVCHQGCSTRPPSTTSALTLECCPSALTPLQAAAVVEWGVWERRKPAHKSAANASRTKQKKTIFFRLHAVTGHALL